MPIWLILTGITGLVLIITLMLQGKDVALFDPKGLIALEQHRLMIRSVIIMLEIAIPTLTVFFFVAWKYRESNTKAKHDPHHKTDKSTVFLIWSLPFITMVLLASMMWPATHKLAPQKSIQNGIEPMTVQVVAMRWKWLFIYPEQKIASVNFLQIPVGTPVQFDITADESPMSSFWIPHLGGQLYAMTGHVNRLNLIADTAGDFNGASAEINGKGFAGMKFIARASTNDEFNAWVEEVKQSQNPLDTAEYKKLLAPSEYNPQAFYSIAGQDIYDNILMKYMGSHAQNTEQKYGTNDGHNTENE